MTLRERLLKLFNDKDYRPMTKEELADYFDLEPADYRLFFESLVDMEKEGLIYLSRKNRYVANHEVFLEGVLEGTSGGFAFFIPDDGSIEDVFIPATDLNSAMHGDRVRIRVTKEKEKDLSAEGEVVKLLSPIEKDIVGTFIKEGKYFFVQPNSKKYAYDIFVPSKFTNKARDNDKVVVRLTKRATKKRNPEGRVIEVLGNRHKGGVEIFSIAREFDLRYSFPAKLDKEIEALPEDVREEDLKGRTDLTDLFTITIDGADAKDFDDAISIEKSGEDYRLFVHIADVAAYVKKGSGLDKEAYKRGNSVYLLDRVIPMLPEKISNELCSLKPGKTRLAHTVEILVDKRARVKDYNFYISYIKSDHRLIYDDVSDFLERDISMGDSFLENKLKIMEELMEILHDEKVKRGSLDFAIPESQILLNKAGKVSAIFPRRRRTADRIIEEFMLLANHTVSEHFAHMEYPFIYRVHEDPDEEKLENFKDIVGPLGYIIKGQEIHSKDLQILLKKAEGEPEERLISTLLLRAMKKARYSPDALGHFALASKYYSHFTAPIRRYADLAIHRIFKAYVKGELSFEGLDKLYDEFDEIADHVSDMERRAEEAERAVEAYMQAEYMKEVVGREFYGVVSSLTSFGVYVELENTVEGLAAFRNQREYYVFDPDNYLVYSRDSDKVLKIGQRVKVRVLGVDEFRNEIDFEIIKW